MNSPYLSFPELPDGYVWAYDDLNRPAGRAQDIDLCRASDDRSAEDVNRVKYSGSSSRTGALAAWVTFRGYVRERNNTIDALTYAVEVEAMQDGIDLLAARCWLGLTGVPDA